MKNERIITHFLSYTTAQGCVKDLTAYFNGRISIARGKKAHPAEVSAENHPFDEFQWVDDVTEIGGIALGAFAVLVPGFGPVLTGGPAAGATIGDVLGDYLETRLRGQAGQGDPNETGAEERPFFMAVDVNSQQEAELVCRIIRQHGGEPHQTQIKE